MGDMADMLMAGTEMRYQREDWTIWLRALSATQKHRYGGETQQLARTVNSGVKSTLWRGQDVEFSVAGDITWANSGYQQRHYGVTANQSQRTGFEAYSSHRVCRKLESIANWSGTSAKIWRLG
jgi:outer membrane scaffolding protein for murein synthesis (MipA/OmpV family)